jgi:hypothetical protein
LDGGTFNGGDGRDSVTDMNSGTFYDGESVLFRLS